MYITRILAECKPSLCAVRRTEVLRIENEFNRDEHLQKPQSNKIFINEKQKMIVISHINEKQKILYSQFTQN